MADTYLMDQKPEKALPILLSLVKEGPENARAQVDLGKAFDKLSRLRTPFTRIRPLAQDASPGPESPP